MKTVEQLTGISRTHIFRTILTALQKREKAFNELGLNERGINKLAETYTEKIMEGILKDASS